MSKPNSLLQISTEGIGDYKNTLLAKNLIYAFTQYSETKDTDALKKSLSAIIKTNFNVNLSVVVDDMRIPAYVEFPQLNDNELQFYDPNTLSGSEHANKKGFNSIGTALYGLLDRKTLKVGGVFAEIPVTVHLGETWLSEITPEQAERYCVPLLHEVGHYIGYVDIIVSQYRTFAVADSLVRGVQSAQTSPEVITFVSSAEGEFGFVVEDKNQLKSVATPEALRVTFLKSLQASDEWLIRGVANYREGELIADQLPAAIIGAKTTALVLADMMSKQNHPAYQTCSYFYGRSIAAIAATFAASLICAPLGILIGASVAFQAYAGREDVKYPSPLERLKALRGELLLSTKSSELTKPIANKLAADLKVIDEEIHRLNGANKSVIDILEYAISPKTRRAVRARDIDSMYVELANNPLWLRAAQLQS